MSAPIVVWFRQDLRLADNPALAAAAETGAPIAPLFILDEASEGLRPLGGASRWWLHGSLAALGDAIADRAPGHAVAPQLCLRRGPAADVLAQFVAEVGARAVYWNRVYEPEGVARDTRIKQSLRANGIEARSFQAGLLFEPGTIQSKSGTPLKVFTAFWRACLAAGEPDAPSAAPKAIAPVIPTPAGDKLSDWALRPSAPDWAGGLRDSWTPGETGAKRRLAHFLDAGLADYAQGRDYPGRSSVSMLSPHLHFGEIGPREVWYAVRHHAAAHGLDRAAEAYLREIGWREFGYHLLFHNPAMETEPLRPEFARFPWRDDPAALSAWQRGRTGYPVVDAGMRQLWHTGWMHNRVRMVVASFLVKHLLIPWQQGEAWFWDTLVDADLASNTANWQWVAGSGADAAPYFRIFNPTTQGEKFDAAGDYVRRWVPEIAGLPDRFIHAPSTAPEDILSAAGVWLGETYPAPIVDHKAARARALAAFESIKATARTG
ncbi:MAG: deoxyribodipyrimidine photo-lyase [Alphaproteobacteria bacterium]|nr:deoxyribodipyrimidine photo-lyase [Alphaproteobacteria bacterium]